MLKSKNPIRLTFIASIIVLLLSSAASYWSISKLLSSEQWVTHTFQVKEKLDFVLSRIKDAETGQRGYLLTGERDFLEPYTGSRAEVLRACDSAQYLTMDNAEQQQDFPKLVELIDHKYRFIDGTLAAKEQGKATSIATLLAGKMIMDSIRHQVVIMEERENKLMDIRQARNSTFVQYSPLLIVLGALISILISIIYYNRTKSSFAQSAILEEQLINKKLETEKQIEVIEKVAKSIADGNYDVRVNKDDLQ
jgi:CHASE3 domain sensor protein